MDDLELLKSRNIELEEQLKLCHEDLIKKDEHIKVLSSMEIKQTSSPSSEPISSKAELVSIQIQLSNAMQKIDEYEIELKGRTDQVEELRSLNRNLNEQVENLVEMNNEMQVKLTSVDQSSSDLNCANARSELAISSLQKELSESLDKIVNLEKELKDLVVTNSEVEKSKESLATRITKFYCELNTYLNLESDSEPVVVFDKIKDLTTENNMLKGEIANLKSTADEREKKYLESRETFRQMMQNVDKDKGDLEEYIRMKKELTFEIEKVQVEKKSIEIHNADLSKRLADTEGFLKETQRILDEKEAQLSKLYLEKRESSHTMVNVNREFESFRESVAGLLSTSLSRCMSTEDSIKERLRILINEIKEKDNKITHLDSKLNNLSEQYERNYETSKETGLKARRVEIEYLDLKDRIKQLEKELSSRDVTRDSLRADKEKFYHFLRRLAAILKMDPYTQEHDLSIIFDGILDRAKGAVYNENERNIDTSQTIISLKKRLRDLKDQLHSRDLHLELMRKKMASQDDKIREALGDADYRRGLVDTEENLKEKLAKMQKKVDQLRDENKALKAELFECSDVKISVANQNKEVETLQHNLQKLERVRQKQAEKIADLTKNLEIYDSDANHTKFVSENAVQSLASELRTMRNALERARKSEKELLDFRVVVGRILGLCVEDLAVPNYDIIRRLEKLVSIPHSGITVAVPVQHYPLKNGFEDANRLLGRKRRSPNRTNFQDSGRPRSVSPIHEVRDSRKY